MSTGPSGDYASDPVGERFFPLFRWLFDEESEFVSSVETKLAESRMSRNVEMYLSRALGLGVLAGALLWLVGTLVTWFLFTFVITDPPILLGLPVGESTAQLLNSIKVPAFIGIGGLVFGSIGFGVGFGAIVSVPYFRSGERKREINVLLSDATSFMYALSVGGMNQLEILEAIARADDTYGEVSKEFQSIILETEYFDTDYRTAIRNQAIQTPSEEFSQFLTDMLSIINSGGDMESFLEDQKDKQMRTSKQEQELVLETLELFGEMFMTLALFPLLLIIILVIMSMLGQAQTFLLYATVYGLIPLIGAGFLVLVSTVVQDEVGDGYLQPDAGNEHQDVSGGAAATDGGTTVDGGTAGSGAAAALARGETSTPTRTSPDAQGIFSLGLIENYVGEYSIFDQIKSREGNYEAMQILKSPHLFFRDHPLATLALTVPTTVTLMAFSVFSGLAPLSIEGLKTAPVSGTFFWLYVPLYVIALPLAVFYEWNVRTRRSIIGKLSENLRKLSSANDTGMTLLESIKIVADTSSGRLAEEFETLHRKVNYGTNLREALLEFNNKYHIPRLARTVKLISKAQETSSEITEVLSTAAQASENQDDIERDRKSRTRMQMVIIIMTFITLLGVMAILKVKFLDVMAGLASQASGGGGSNATSFGGSVDTDLLTMLFFHAVALQGIMSGLIAGYIREVNLLSGLKFVVVLPTLALLVFMFI